MRSYLLSLNDKQFLEEEEEKNWGMRSIYGLFFLFKNSFFNFKLHLSFTQHTSGRQSNINPIETNQLLACNDTFKKKKSKGKDFFLSNSQTVSSACDTIRPLHSACSRASKSRISGLTFR